MYAIKYIVVLACLSTPAASSDDEDNDEGFLLPAIRAALRYTSGNLIQSDQQIVDQHQLIEASDKSSLAAATDLLSGSLDEWKQSMINIGVTGDSGTGKSSLVNALRGLTGDDYGAAHVGVTETTMEPESYKHPDNPNMLLWDLPGVGTPRFTRENYFDKIQLMKYDYFIIVTSTRFTDDDKWLVTELKKRNKRFYFVRTKISIDIENDKKSHPKTHDQEKVCSGIRKDIMKHINNLANDIYLIDSYDTDKYDFNKLSYKLVVDAPELKREAMLFTLKIFSEDMIKAKKAALKERIPTVCLVSAIVGAVPIPGLDVAVDIAILMREIKFYKEQFGLTEEQIRTYATKMKLSVDDLTLKLDLKSKAIQCTTKGIAAYMVKKGAKKMAERFSSKILKYILPGVGSIACGAVSYYTCSTTLESLLDEIADDALKIARHQHIETSDKSSLAAAKDLLSGSLDEWKRSMINIGVTGDSGTGKSSLVNALRGLTGDDYGAAHVGVTETTMELESYEHPDNPNMLLWDLPGVGTPRFTRKNYFDKIQLMKYDYFIIVTSTRFTDDDKWLVTELKKRNKRFYFVRTKISIDIENDKKSHPKTHDQEKVCSGIRKDIMKHINNLANDIYLIDSYDTDKYDFKKLSYKLVVDAPELKREAMLFTLKIFSEDMIKAKKAALEERIHTVCLVSAIVGAIPIPGLDVAVDIAILMREIKFYKEQFGLTEEQIRTYAKKMKISVDELTLKLDLQSKAIQCTAKGITAYMVKKGAKKMAERFSSNILKYILPGVGSIACGAVSYYTCSTTLESLLDEIADDALKIARYEF